MTNKEVNLSANYFGQISNMLLRADITWLLLTSDFNNKEVALGQEVQDGFREEGCPVV